MRRNKLNAKLLPRRRFLLRSGYIMSAAMLGGSLGACKPQARAEAETEAEPEVARERSLRLPEQVDPAPDTPSAPEEPNSQDLTRISLVDTIIPKDESIGAVELGLDDKLTQEMASQPKAKEWVERMVHSVSQICLAQHRKEFRDLDVEQREQFLNELLANRVNAITWNDLRRLRRMLLTWYYQSEEGAATIGFYLPSHYPSYPGQKQPSNTGQKQGAA